MVNKNSEEPDSELEDDDDNQDDDCPQQTVINDAEQNLDEEEPNINTADETEERKFSLTFAENLPQAQSTVMTHQPDDKS